MKPMTRWIRMAPSGKALLLPGSLAARKPILISQILPTVCSILARVRPEPIIARVGQPGPSEVFTFAEIHEDVIDDGSFAQADPGAWGHYPPLRQKSAFNAAFVDGRAAYHRLEFTGPRWWGKTPENAADWQDFSWFTKRVMLH